MYASTMKKQKNEEEKGKKERIRRKRNWMKEENEKEERIRRKRNWMKKKKNKMKLEEEEK